MDLIGAEVVSNEGCIWLHSWQLTSCVVALVTMPLLISTSCMPYDLDGKRSLENLIASEKSFLWIEDVCVA